MKGSLFQPIVDVSKMHPSFKGVCDSIGHLGAKKLMDEMFAQLPNPDRNFSEQFQTTGFDSRVFELALFSYFKNSGYRVERVHEQPDFIVGNGYIKVAVEAVTSSPQANVRFQNTIPYMEKLSLDEVQQRIDNDFPVRIGSALFSKLNKRYWELPHCKDIPLVLAVQPFHEAGSLTYTSIGLFSYLFGERTTTSARNNGDLVFRNEQIKTHRVGNKEIPSNFFSQPLTENISAVIYSNSLTVSKFTRMAYQKGYFRDGLKIRRNGFDYPDNDYVLMPPQYSYILGEPEAHIETWAESLVVFLNPSARNPLPRDFFSDVSCAGYEDGKYFHDLKGFHPLISQTFIEMDSDKIKSSIGKKYE